MEKICKICLESKPCSDFILAGKYTTVKGEKRIYYIYCKLCGYKKHYRYTMDKYKGLVNTYAVRKEKLKKYTAKNKLKVAARQSITWKLRSGSLVKGVCFCGETKVEAHHYKGYEPENWLNVQWLCHKHHREADRLMTQKI